MLRLAAKLLFAAALLLPHAGPAFAQRVQPGDSDKTLQAMRDELTRARERLVAPNSERPFYIQYRLLDLDGRTISAEFGALVNTITSRNRFMSVEVRVGDRSEEHTSELQSRLHLVCRLLLEKKNGEQNRQKAQLARAVPCLYATRKH